MIEQINEKLISMRNKTDINVLEHLEYSPSNDFWFIASPDDLISAWVVLSMIEEGLKVSKDWIDGEEIMVIKA